MKLCLQVISGQLEGRGTTLKPPGGVLGRGAGCSLVVEHESVSLQHAELRFNQGSWYLYQRSGRSPTLADGQPVGGSPVVLHERGRIALGTVAIDYWQEKLDPEEEAPPPIEKSSEPEPAPTFSVRQNLSVPTQQVLAQMTPLQPARPIVQEPPTLILNPNRVPVPRERACPPTIINSRTPSGGIVAPYMPPDGDPVTMANPSRLRAVPPRATTPARGEDPPTLMNLPRLRPTASPAGEASRPASGPGPSADEANQSAALRSECRRLEGEAQRLEREVARLKRENEQLKDARAAIEAQLLNAHRTADQAPTRGAPADGQALRGQARKLLESFAANLEQASLSLNTGDIDQARTLLRRSSFDMADLTNLFE